MDRFPQKEDDEPRLQERKKMLPQDVAPIPAENLDAFHELLLHDVLHFVGHDEGGNRDGGQGEDGEFDHHPCAEGIAELSTHEAVPKQHPIQHHEGKECDGIIIEGLQERTDPRGELRNIQGHHNPDEGRQDKTQKRHQEGDPQSKLRPDHHHEEHALPQGVGAEREVVHRSIGRFDRPFLSELQRNDRDGITAYPAVNKAPSQYEGNERKADHKREILECLHPSSPPMMLDFSLFIPCSKRRIGTARRRMLTVAISGVG